MTNLEKEKLIDIISEERLTSYQFKEEDDFSILYQRYIYNIKISEAFYPVLSAFEIALRNRIYNVFDKLIKPNWLMSELSVQNLLLDSEYKILLEAEKKLKAKKKTITKGALISELTFGFWINLCKKSYKTIFWDKRNVFESVFPNFPKNSEMNRIKFISAELKLILQLRNRIFHHEIIINNKLGINNCYDIIRRQLGYISDEYLKMILNNICRLNGISKQKP